MIEVTIYEAIDGKRFMDKLECIKYEETAVKVVSFIDTLPLKGINNEKGYIQHTMGTKALVKNKILEFFYELFGSKHLEITYTVGRLIDDSGYRCISRLNSIFNSIDTKERQWNQPYFANHPEEGEQKCINP